MFNRQKKLWLVAVAIFLLAFLLTPVEVRAETQPLTEAPSAILVDGQTGQVLWQRKSHQKRAIASTTKMMTAIVVLERSNLDEVVATSKKTEEVDEAELYLTKGERRTVKDLLYGLMLKSANDAAAALAEHVGGSVSRFVEMMNSKAKAIGTQNTHFSNPHGLTSDGHHSTAYDLALMARYGLSNPQFAQLVRTKRYVMPWPDHSYPRKLENHNKLVLKYPFVKGVKTGYTKRAGYCLVAAAERDENLLISVVLGDKTSQACYTDSLKLLNYGFNNFRPVKLVEKDKVYKTIVFPVLGNKKLKAVAKNDLIWQVRKGSKDIVWKTDVKKEIKLPVQRGQRLGEVQVVAEKKPVGTVILVADRSLKSPTLWQRIVFGCRSLMRKLKGFLGL